MPKISLLSESQKMRIYSVSDKDFPENSYILCSQPFRDVLYKPYLAGIGLQNQMEQVGAALVQAITQLCLKGVKKESMAELIYMSGGLYYSLNFGFKQVHKFAIPQCFIGIQRVRMEGTEGQFSARVGYENFESLPDNAAIIIGDTIASGATMIKGLQYLEDELFEKGYKLSQLVVCTLAGSTEGARRIKKSFEKLRESNPGLKCYYIACEQFFTLMPDGTDLRFIEKDSVMPDETREYTKAVYGEWLGKNMKCAVFDWGTRCKNPSKHYHEFLEFVEATIKDKKTPSDARAKLEEMKKAVLLEMKESEKAL